MPIHKRIKFPPETPSPRSPSSCSPLHGLLSPITANNDSCHSEFLKALARTRRRQELREERKGLRWIAAAAFILVISMVIGSLLIVPTAKSDHERRKPSLRSLRKRDGKAECVNGKKVEEQNQVSEQTDEQASSSEVTTLITTTSQIVTEASPRYYCAFDISRRLARALGAYVGQRASKGAFTANDG